MPSGVVIYNWAVLNVTVAVQALWIVKVRNDIIRLEEAVDIRRKRLFSVRKNEMRRSLSNH